MAAFFPTEIGLFLGGGLGYLFYRKVAEWDFPGTGFLGKLLLFALILYSLLFQSLDIERTYKEGMFLVLTALAIPFIFHWTKGSRIDRFVGDLSYPIYLSQYFVIGLMRIYGVPEYLSSLVGLGVLIPLSALIVILIEQPLSRFRHRLF